MTNTKNTKVKKEVKEKKESKVVKTTKKNTKTVKTPKKEETKVVKTTKEIKTLPDISNEKMSFSKTIYELFKMNYKAIIIILIFSIIILYPVPYYVFTSGGITDLSDRFVVEDGYEQKGSYNLSYVSQRNGNVFSFLLSFVMPDWELVEKEKYQINDDESFDEIMKRDTLSLLQANQTALYVAYTEAGKEPVINSVSFYVVATYDYLASDEKIMIGDQLIKIDDTTITDFNDIANYINSKKDGDYVILTLDRDGKEVISKVRVNEINGTNLMGLIFYRIMNLEVTPKISFAFAADESGSSAGLMTTLAIYDSLIEEDLTHGLKIAGTGTISIDGSVGEIGGVKYKIGGAEKGGADIFFVPMGSNYLDALEEKEKKGYDIELVPVETFEDAVNYLRNLKDKE